MGSSGELESARRRLSDAYARARAVGYQTGSVQMRELAAAEQAYQQARSRDDRARAAQQPDLRVTDLDGSDTTSVARSDAAETEIDLRDPGQSRPGEVAPGTDERAGPPRCPGC